MARWLEAAGLEAGATLDAQRACDLAHAWWGDRLAHDWRPRTMGESQAILQALDLRGAFWQFA